MDNWGKSWLGGKMGQIEELSTTLGDIRENVGDFWKSMGDFRRISP